MDEVGRGCLLGPVVAAAVILPAVAEALAGGCRRQRQQAGDRHPAPPVGSADSGCGARLPNRAELVREIDRLNILQASLLAMKRAVIKLSVQPELCLIDRNQRIPGLPVPQETMLRGDSRSVAIASASIVAKVCRDLDLSVSCEIF